MNIHYKAIVHERTEDAPFIGALICATDCKFNCDGCFNQHLKDAPVLIRSPEDIVKLVKSNPFNQSIIFSGLEWSLQINEAITVSDIARANSLQTMLYTGNDCVPTAICEHFDYVKCGRYLSKLTCNDNIQYGVKLASSNQTILKKGKDY